LNIPAADRHADEDWNNRPSFEISRLKQSSSTTRLERNDLRGVTFQMDRARPFFLSDDWRLISSINAFMLPSHKRSATEHRLMVRIVTGKSLVRHGTARQWVRPFNNLHRVGDDQQDQPANDQLTARRSTSCFIVPIPGLEGLEEKLCKVRGRHWS